MPAKKKGKRATSDAGPEAFREEAKRTVNMPGRSVKPLNAELSRGSNYGQAAQGKRLRGSMNSTGAATRNPNAVAQAVMRGMGVKPPRGGSYSPSATRIRGGMMSPFERNSNQVGRDKGKRIRKPTGRPY